MGKHKHVLALLLLFLILTRSWTTHAQEYKKPTRSNDSIEVLIAAAVEPGKTDTAKALVLFKDALARSVFQHSHDNGQPLIRRYGPINAEARGGNSLNFANCYSKNQ